MKILNLASGKIPPLGMENNIYDNQPTFYVRVDYCNDVDLCSSISDIMIKDMEWDKKSNIQLFSDIDIKDFLNEYLYYFDKIICYRYLEHVPFSGVPYFIYQLSTSIEVNGEIDIIVPDYKKLAKMLIEEKVNSKNFEFNNILLTTEMVNEPNCPHASIWTVERLKYFFELENRFKIKSIETDFLFDNRDIYIRMIASKI